MNAVKILLVRADMSALFGVATLSEARSCSPLFIGKPMAPHNGNTAHQHHRH